MKRPSAVEFVLLFACFIFWVFPAGSFADEKTDVSVKAQVDRAIITIGDPVEYAVTITYDPALEILSPIPPPSADILKIKKIEDLRSESKGMRTQGKKFTLTSFRLGDFILDPVEIRYRSKGGEIQTVSTNPIYLRVKSIAEGEEKTDIRGIKGTIPMPRGSWLLILIILALLFIIGYFFWRRLRQPSSKSRADEASLLSPEEEAFSLLDQLFDSDLIRRGKIKEYYLRLSEILRRYFERRYQILAIEATTSEIMRSLRSMELSETLLPKIEEVLRFSDLAKFAKWRPEPPEIVSINQKAKQIIKESTPPEVGSGI